MKEKLKNKEDYKKYFKKALSYFDSFYEFFKATFLIVILFLAVIFTLAAGSAMGYFASLVEDSPQLSKNEFQADIYNYNQKSTLFYADASVISDLRSDLLRTPITLDQVSPLLTNAIIATEDENFYEHKGIVPKAIVRAAAQELTGASSVSGGSTITQQLIKQQILTNEVTHSRKAVEILYALDLEKKLDKDEILQAYMNVSPFGRNHLGQNIAGVAEASEGIFGVQSKDLNLVQAAFLAGLPKSPISYSPYTQYGELKEDLEAGLSRKNDVLYSMFREGYIKEKDYQEALNYNLEEDFLVQSEEEEKKTNRSYVYDLVEIEAQEIIKEKLLEKDAITKEELEGNPDLTNEYAEKANTELRNGGYKVYSTIDPKVHQALEDKVEQTKSSFGDVGIFTVVNDEGEKEEFETPIQVSGSLVENESGRVIAFVGGKDYELDQRNNAFNMRRGSGSAIKPLITYGPALAENFITPATIIPDTEEIVPDGSETKPISNYGRITDTWDSARHWLAVSQNIPNVKIYRSMLRNNINPKKYIRAMGIGTEAIGDNEFENASTSIGGFSFGPTPTELAAAYAAIGNKGVYNEPFVIERIENSKDEVIYEHEYKPTRVWSETANYLLYDMLRDVAKYGTARSINSYLKFNVDLASKTGTTNKFRDVWYAGVTPKVSYVSWMGYEDPRAYLKNYAGLSPSRRNLRNWSNIMNTVYDTNPELLGLSERMNPPGDGSVVRRSVVPETGMKAGNVKLANGSVVSVSGENKSELFARNNIPGSTIYNFAVGAKNKELEAFWTGQNEAAAKELEEKLKEEEEKKAEEDQKKEEEKKEKEEESKEEEAEEDSPEESENTDENN